MILGLDELNLHMKMETPNVKRQKDVNDLITKCEVFFAFSDKQLAEGKAKLPEGEKLVNIGLGGFMPKRNIEMYLSGMKQIDKDFRQAMKDQKARRDHIEYELWNHEAFYTRDIESTLDALGDEFTREEVLHVFKYPKTKHTSLDVVTK